MSRTYCGTALGGTARDASIASGSNCVAASKVTMSPELMVSAGLLAALKFPMLTVLGVGISVNSAAAAPLGSGIKDASTSAMRSFDLRNPAMEDSQRFGFVGRERRPNISAGLQSGLPQDGSGFRRGQKSHQRFGGLRLSRALR